MSAASRERDGLRRTTHAAKVPRLGAAVTYLKSRREKIDHRADQQHGDIQKPVGDASSAT